MLIIRDDDNIKDLFSGLSFERPGKRGAQIARLYVFRLSEDRDTGRRPFQGKKPHHVTGEDIGAH